MSLEKIDALLKKLTETGGGAAPSVSPDKQASDIIRNAAAALLKKHPEMKKDIDAFLKGAVGDDALLKQLQKKEAVSSSGVNWAHFDSRIGSAIEKLTAARDVEHSKDTEYSAPLDMMMKIGSAIDDLADTVYILRDHKGFDGDYSSALRRAGDAIASAGQAAMSLAAEISDNPRGIAGQSEEKSGVKSSYKGHEIKVIPHERGLKNVLYIDGKEQEAGFFSVGAAQKHGEKLIDDPEK